MYLILPNLCLALELEAWPVSSTTTQLAYRNVYCAMCHGLNPLVKTDFKGTFHEHNYADIRSVEWWASKVMCDLQSIINYLKDQPGHAKLIQLILRCVKCSIFLVAQDLFFVIVF